jgi:hypothetical protein
MVLLDFIWKDSLYIGFCVVAGAIRMDSWRLTVLEIVIYMDTLSAY